VALIGADGIWSSVRHHLFPGGAAAILGPDRLARNARCDPRCRANITAPRVAALDGSNAHLVAYPISGARQINVVAVVSGTWNRPGWSAPGEANEIRTRSPPHDGPRPRGCWSAPFDEWRRWALFTVPDNGDWSEGAIALLGDAVHAMLPFAAQGAGMAIEDAAVLAKP